MPTPQPTPTPTPTPQPVSGNPFAGAKWFIDPYSNAKRQADAWRDSRPEDAAQMDKIASQPQADWFGDWNSDVASAVNARVTQITDTGALPVLVAYNIPKRDCNSYSGGGATSPEAYRQWIRDFARGIGNRRAVVILEPDALAQLGCLSESDRQVRLSLIKDAVEVLTAQGAAVYIDAGHPSWVPASTMAERLRQAGIERARGVALNVSNFQWTDANIAYAYKLQSYLGHPIHAVIDTSRNGLGPAPDGEWCNPPGRALGPRPTANAGDPIVDALFWIKRPGESDGTCNGGPAAGTWWPEYALGLAERAAY